MAKKVVIIGGGGHAKVVASATAKLPQFEVAGYVDMVDNGPLLGFPYLGDDNDLPQLVEDGVVDCAALGVGSIKSQAFRRKLAGNIQAMDIPFPAIVSVEAIVDESVTVGEGTFIAPGVVINCDSQIGDFAIINTRASIDHDCKIGDFTHIAPGSTLSGGVSIGSDCQIGTGATIIQSITVTGNTVIGAGSAVIKSITEPGTYVGIPARKKT